MNRAPVSCSFSPGASVDRKSTRLNSSHSSISYAVFCLKKKTHYMISAFAACIMLDRFVFNYWIALMLAPLIVGALGLVIERTFLIHLYGIDPINGLLLT